MASDGNCQGKPAFQGFSLAIETPTAAEADTKFNALAEGGQVQMPLTKTFFSEKFGMVADRFGVSWMVLVEDKH
jgi:PhnB protein